MIDGRTFIARSEYLLRNVIVTETSREQATVIGPIDLQQATYSILPLAEPVEVFRSMDLSTITVEDLKRLYEDVNNLLALATSVNVDLSQGLDVLETIQSTYLLLKRFRVQAELKLEKSERADT